jgi:hypothetical protein
MISLQDWLILKMLNPMISFGRALVMALLVEFSLNYRLATMANGYSSKQYSSIMAA